MRLPDAVVAGLDGARRAAQAVLADNGEAPATELAKASGTAACGVGGFMQWLGRQLSRAGVKCFEMKPLPGGESRRVYVPPSEGE